MFQCLIVEIDQREVGLVTDGLPGKKPLHFHSRPARQIADSRLSFGPDDTQRFFQQFVLQITEPITMRL